MNTQEEKEVITVTVSDAQTVSDTKTFSKRSRLAITDRQHSAQSPAPFQTWIAKDSLIIPPHSAEYLFCQKSDATVNCGPAGIT